MDQFAHLCKICIYANKYSREYFRHVNAIAHVSKFAYGVYLHLVWAGAKVFLHTCKFTHHANLVIKTHSKFTHVCKFYLKAIILAFFSQFYINLYMIFTFFIFHCLFDFGEMSSEDFVFLKLFIFPATMGNCCHNRHSEDITQ